MLEPGLQGHVLLRRRAERANGNVPGRRPRRGHSDRGQLSKVRRTIAPIPLTSVGSEFEGPSDGAPETCGRTDIAIRIRQGRFPRFQACIGNRPGGVPVAAGAPLPFGMSALAFRSTIAAYARQRARTRTCLRICWWPQVHCGYSLYCVYSTEEGPTARQMCAGGAQ